MRRLQRFELKNAILELIQGKIKISEALQRLACSRRTIERSRRRFIERGPKGLRDQRGGKRRGEFWLAATSRSAEYFF